ncbi:tRNA (N6-isopentenyl adenosine(37)-C2)-methylthiotransferase MiaB [Desulfopila inferna]|uniref:tRNA (N6-isopentenyl adenosine(37)-C2)-methylthiotransferase MiaB n=1 Tax=Desulfopila inferna TaxID=468528 RepID=UPI0027D28C2A|nr:tRNA (N6-isopentenyl adenosine(37)-C2)-methylthiotransferase MiaB [Desulfopila inferna]
MSSSFFIKTFGCQMNERDSEIIAQSLQQHDYVEALDMDSADLIVLNTCSIRAKAEQKVMSLLGYLRKNKKRNPKLKICVAGCVAQQEGKALIERMPHVNLVVGTQHINQIPALIANTDKHSQVATELKTDYQIPRFIPETETHDNWEAPQFSGGKRPFSKFVTIMQGCNNYCTYCVVPHTRGREVSRMFKDIVDEVKVLVESGVQDITLLGQNVNSYGLTNQVSDDGSACSFPQLLKKVSQVPNLKRLRFTTSNPKDLSHDLMRCFRDLPNLCPQFHLPVQSGSDKVLKRMNRKYTMEKYIQLVQDLREYCPEIILTTDIIVGFPGETEDDFQKTMELLEIVRFDGSFSFKYSDRPGTSSVKLAGKVDEEEKSRRLRLFQNRQNEICLDQNNKHIGRIYEVMVESGSAGKYQCRSITNHIVHIEAPSIFEPGSLISVKIHHAGHHSLQGKVL